MDMKNTFVHSIIIASIFLTAVACGSSEKENEPEKVASDITEQKLTADHIYIEVSPSDLGSVKKGDEINLAAEDTSMSFTLTIRRVSEAVKGIKSISAYVDDSETGQAALIFRGGRLSGQIDIFDQDLRYSVAFDTAQGAYYLQQVNKDSLDVLQGSKPLTPDNKTIDN
ncbi:MAG: hypothetical protein CL666_16255 [Balneola sp.]|nr:hypothetical protein [Balneola sp.]|tara:strand:- start:164944 stop:165450 length:507 start_codon:yes stop_codon:yes gene_type:complete